jgi:ribonucleoside-triphosphate reductase
MELAKQSLELKREKISKYLEMGLYPFTKRYLGTYKNHFSTMGVNGINEMVRNFTNDEEDMTTETGIAFGIEFLEHMRDKMKHFQEETGNMYNLEASPSEGAMYRFAKEDAKRYPDIIQAGYEGAPYYTNSSQLPVNYTDDLFEALKLQEEIQSKYTGGTMMHLYMNERISSGEAAKLLVKKVVDNFSIPYFTITPTFSICPKHGYIAGEYEYCPKCDQELLAKKNRAACAC